MYVLNCDDLKRVHVSLFLCFNCHRNAEYSMKSYKSNCSVLRFETSFISSEVSRFQVLKTYISKSRSLSSHPEVFLGKGFLKIYNKFTGEHPCWSVISIKLQSNFIEIALHHGCSNVNLLHIFRTSFPKITFGRLILEKCNYLLIFAFIIVLFRISYKHFYRILAFTYLVKTTPS